MMPSRLRIDITYGMIRLLEKLQRWMESSLWGYEWCKKCRGDGKFPNSGMWVQPDGYKICPKCRGHRWNH